MSNGNLYRMAAFTASPAGGNPAGVWIGDRLPDDETMQRIAADVGFSETAFLAPASGAERTVRYFSPLAEVPFCGHATIAAGAVLGGDSDGTEYRLATAAGTVPIRVRADNGRIAVSLTSVETRQRAIDDKRLDDYLAALCWQRDELDTSLPPAVAYAGAWHLVLMAADKSRLDRLDYHFDSLKALMLEDDLTTLQLVWREDPTTFHARDPFPVGGVVEDPATGAAAAAFGGYLRDAGHIDTPAAIRIHQGVCMGRPSLLEVGIPPSGGITVSGTAVQLPEH